MPKTLYFPLEDINDFQTEVMRFIDTWVHEQKTPVPHREILTVMKKRGYHDFTTYNAISVLIRNGYIRKACVETTNRTFYVQLRNLNHYDRTQGAIPAKL